MNILTAMVLALVLLSAPAGADDPPVPAPPTPPATPADPPRPPAPTPPLTPPAPPASPRPDFATLQKHLVVVKDGMENDARQAPGFSISDQGHIVTYGGALRDNQSYLVSTADGRVVPASRIKADEQTGLWILQLSNAGHGLTALPFARTVLQAAAPLHAPTFNPSGPERFTSVPGTVTQLMNTEQGQMIQHNALFSLASAGTPLLNRCFQAVGVNVLQKRGFLRREVDPTQEGSAQSIASASLGSLLASLNLSLPVADTACLSLEEDRRAQEAERQREREAAAHRAREAAEEARRKEEALQREQREREAAEDRARRVEAERRRNEQEAQRQLEQTRQEQQAELQRQQEEGRRREEALQRERDEAEQRQRRILLIGSIIGGLVLLGVVLVIRRKQKRLQMTEQERHNISGALDRAQSERSYAEEQDRLRSTAPDIFLEGETPPIALKIPGASLVERAGAVVGRSPAASAFVINHEQISRQHFRLSLVAQQVMIEDLGSTNGTSVDGLALEPGNQVPVREGSRLALGDLELTLHIGR